MSFRVNGHGLTVSVENGYVRLDMDLETAEWIASELPSGDQITRLLARGVVACALEACPHSAAITGASNVIGVKP
jgi:hypothetical protein